MQPKLKDDSYLLRFDLSLVQLFFERHLLTSARINHKMYSKDKNFGYAIVAIWCLIKVMYTLVIRYHQSPPSWIVNLKFVFFESRKFILNPVKKNSMIQKHFAFLRVLLICLFADILHLFGFGKIIKKLKQLRCQTPYQNSSLHDKNEQVRIFNKELFIF